MSLNEFSIYIYMFNSAKDIVRFTDTDALAFVDHKTCHIFVYALTHQNIFTGSPWFIYISYV